MDQVHKRFTVEQVKALFAAYCQGTMDRTEVEEVLKIGKTRFFAVLRAYRRDAAGFSVEYQRATPTRLSAEIEAEIEAELRREQALVEDERLPISGYNYAAVHDRLQRRGLIVSATTIINRAKHLGCYQPHRKKKAHDRQVVTTATGALIQHDASLLLMPMIKSPRMPR
jgi:transposase